MKQLILFCFCCAFQQTILSQSNLVRSTTSASGSSETITSSGNTYIIQQSIGQSSVIGTKFNGNYIFRQGFIQPDVWSKIIDIDVPLNLEMQLYPNPFEEQISLTFNEEVNNGISIVIYNTLGAMLYDRNYPAGQQIDVNLNWLPSGAYIIRVIANKKQFITKILKK